VVEMSDETTGGKLPPQPLDDWFLDLLECPACDYHRPLKLNESGDALNCDCGRHAFPVRDGIPILLVEEAVTLDESADPSVPRKKEAR
jgi:uncharacterized protein YbaR (Trm112 family)